MELKHSVKTLGLKPELSIALMCCASVYREHNAEMVITSITDSEHSRSSKHYEGYAADLRIRNLYGVDLEEFTQELRDSLTNDYDVVLEKTHIHIEYDPKSH